MPRRSVSVLRILLSALPLGALAAEAPDPSAAFLAYVRTAAAVSRADDRPPASLAAWQAQRGTLRQHLLEAWGGFPAAPCDLAARKLGEFSREGYRVEKIVIQTRPSVWITANAYVPDRAGPLPAVLAVHGHWPGAKQDPIVQARCIGLARLGFFVLAVDALGAGERGVGKALGEYHGDMTAATLLPVGLPLSGMQVYENMRAVDYLLTRPEVDRARIGITGASGGGNQTMYAGAWDDRFAAVVPVCSVGNYQAFLGSACCLCEVVPGALRFTEEWAVLGSVAPRALLVINATRDSVQFSVPEARKSVSAAQVVFDLQPAHDRLRHLTFESPHDYSQAMREAMYGWMSRHLKAEGNGAPIAEAAIKTEDPEALRCFPGNSRPDDFMTIPRFAAAEAGRLLARIPVPTDARQARDQRAAWRSRLARCVQGGDDTPSPMTRAQVTRVDDVNGRTIRFTPEPRIELVARQEPATPKPAKLAVLIDLDGSETARASEAGAALRAAGWSLVTPDLRATGRLVVAKSRVGRAPDHNPAEWALWIGRPLIGQWITDVRRTLDALELLDGQLPREIAVVGHGPAGLIATMAAALDPRITRAAALGSLASYVTDVPYEHQWLGLIAPGILRDVGDIPHLAALIAPRRLIIAAAVNGAGRPLDAAVLADTFAFTRKTYVLENANDAFITTPELKPAELARRLE